MAALMESIAFTNISNETDILEISDTNEEGEILLSFKKKSFVTYKLSDQKPQKSWSVRHGVTLTSPVRWDHSHSRFITVTNNHDIKLFDKDLSDFSRAKTKHSPDVIHGVLTIQDYPDVIVLYANGCVGFLEDIKEKHNTGPLTKEGTIVWYKAMMLSGTLNVIFVARVKDEVHLYVNWFSTEEGRWYTKSAVISTHHNSSQCCAIDGILVNDSVNVYILWTDGVLTRASVQRESIDVINLPQSITGVNGKCGMVVIDPTHIAVAGCLNKNDSGIGIFDIKFGIQQTWQSFIDKPQNKCKIFCMQGHLFVPCVRTLYACKYECRVSTVGSILGRNLTNTAEIPQHHLWSSRHKREEKEGVQEDLSKQFTQLAENKSMSFVEFKTLFKKLMNVLEDSKNHHWLTSSHMTSLIQRMVEETKFWPKRQVQQLVEKQFIPISSIDTIVDSLIEHTEVSILLNLIIRTNNLPEKCLCKALSFYLQCDEKDMKSVVSDIEGLDIPVDDEEMDIDDEGMEDDEEGELNKPALCPFSVHKALLLDILLMKPYSDVFLLECLRLVNFKDAQKLLEYLCYLLERKPLLPQAENSKQNRLTTPQVVDWLCLVVDAHMTQFVLSPYSHLTLIKLHNIVSSQVEFMSSLVNLEALLLQLKEKSVLMQDRKVGQYCIEVLHIM